MASFESLLANGRHLRPTAYSMPSPVKVFCIVAIFGCLFYLITDVRYITPSFFVSQIGLDPSWRPHPDQEVVPGQPGSRHRDHYLTSDLFKKLPSEINKPAGKNELPIKFRYRNISTKNKLDIVIIPHSHNDPGWLHTFEEYYDMSVRSILDNALKFLTDNKDMRFVEAEMSFFELWWSEQSGENKDNFKKLVESKQLEFVGGGWVMTDEANAHYFSTVMEMFEGHEFLKNNFDGYQPRSQWSIDPFGLSTTVAHLMKLAGLRQGVMNRVHHAIKDIMAQKQIFEFHWRQPWKGDDDSDDFLCHVMPYLYFADYQCGPDRNICIKFDYLNSPIDITDSNVAQMSQELLKQFRLKAQFYRTDTVLALQGHDFDFIGPRQWERTFKNYMALAEHINKMEEYNAELHIGTPADYFEIVRRKTADGKYRPIPTMTGDFFPYSEIMKHYWTGYFTSRPFYKHMDRTLAHYIRTTDILFSLAHWESVTSPQRKPFSIELYNLLVEARRWHGLFQHHDAITGTARADVVADYGRKLEKALINCKQVIEEAINYLTLSDGQKPKLIEIPANNRTLIRLVIAEPATLVVFNSLPRRLDSTVCLLIGDADLQVQSNDGDVIQQRHPNIELNKGAKDLVVNGKELCFLAKQLPPLGSKTFTLKKIGDPSLYQAKVSVSKNVAKDLIKGANIITGNSLTLKNAMTTVSFNASTGYLAGIKTASLSVELRLGFYSYDPNEDGPPKGGAYVFSPSGEAKPLDSSKNKVVVIEGAVRREVIVLGPKAVHLLHRVQLDHDAAPRIRNQLDVHEQYRIEVAMRLESPDLNTDEQFFTDSNGFQHLRRPRLAQLPLPAHFYPFTTSAFVQSSKVRLTGLTAQPLGIGSLKPGQVEIILERRMNSDDGKGMEEGVHDNKCTSSEFAFLLEQVDDVPSNASEGASLTVAAQQASQMLLYPSTVAAYTDAQPPKITDIHGLAKDLPSDVHLVALRQLSQPTEYKNTKSKSPRRQTPPKPSAALILHRFQRPKSSSIAVDSSTDLLNVEDIWSKKPALSTVMSLTALEAKSDEQAQSLVLNPMDIKTVVLRFSDSD